MPPPPHREPWPTSRPTTPVETITTISLQDGNDGISTIEYPYIDTGNFNGAGGMQASDSTVGESDVSCEHKRIVHGVGGRKRLDTGDSSLPQNNNITIDDGTIEDLFHEQTRNGSYGGEELTVVAPLGKIGIIVDNPNDDVPIIVGIKDTSVLYDKVHIGDLVISLDEIPCRGMSAGQVSRLINSRSQNPARSFVLLRGSGKSH